MNELVVIGKIVSTFGVKGELKVISDFKYQDRAFKIGSKILLNNIEHTITSIRRHKQYILITLDNIYDINKVLDFIGYNIYYAKDNLNLASNEYLDSDLINALVIDEDKKIGTINEIMDNGIYKLVKVNKIIIPLVDNYVIRFDKDKKILYTKNTKDLII